MLLTTLFRQPSSSPPAALQPSKPCDERTISIIWLRQHKQENVKLGMLSSTNDVHYGRESFYRWHVTIVNTKGVVRWFLMNGFHPIFRETRSCGEHHRRDQSILNFHTVRVRKTLNITDELRMSARVLYSLRYRISHIRFVDCAVEVSIDVCSGKRLSFLIRHLWYY